MEDDSSDGASGVPPLVMRAGEDSDSSDEENSIHSYDGTSAPSLSDEENSIPVLMANYSSDEEGSSDGESTISTIPDGSRMVPDEDSTILAPTIPAVVRIIGETVVIVETVVEGLSNMYDTRPHHLQGDRPELWGLPGGMWLEPIKMPATAAVRIRGGGPDDMSVESVVRLLVQAVVKYVVPSYRRRVVESTHHFVCFTAHRSRVLPSKEGE